MRTDTERLIWLLSHMVDPTCYGGMYSDGEFVTIETREELDAAMDAEESEK